MRDTTTKEVEDLLQTYDIIDVLEFADVSVDTVLYFLFTETDLLDDFPEDLWPL